MGQQEPWLPLTGLRTDAVHTPRLRARLARALPIVLALAAGVLLGTHYPTYLSVLHRRPLAVPSLLPAAPPPPPASWIPPVPSLPLPRAPIPNVVHYVYGLSSGEPSEFLYYAYLAMRSAMTVLRPERVIFHCAREPVGHWWDRVRGWEGWVDSAGVQHGAVEVVPLRDVVEVGAARRPVLHYAHKADVLRLEILLRHGGIYLDIDTFVLRPLAPTGLMAHDAVLGLEARSLGVRWPAGDDEARPKGLCNAVIIARPGAEFLRLWLESYESFDAAGWEQHSVVMPWTLAQLYPTTVTVLSERAFHWPTWTPDHVRSVHESTEYDFEASGQLMYHAWESKARPYPERLDPVSIMRTESAFTRMARRFREPDEEARWLAARAAAAGDAPGD